MTKTEITTEDVNLVLEMKELVRNRNGNFHVEDSEDGGIEIYLDEIGEDGTRITTFIGNSVPEAVDLLKAMQGLDIARAKAAVQSKPFRLC